MAAAKFWWGFLKKHVDKKAGKRQQNGRGQEGNPSVKQAESRRQIRTRDVIEARKSYRGRGSTELGTETLTLSWAIGFFVWVVTKEEFWIVPDHISLMFCFFLPSIPPLLDFPPLFFPSPFSHSLFLLRLLKLLWPREHLETQLPLSHPVLAFWSDTLIYLKQFLTQIPTIPTFYRWLLQDKPGGRRWGRTEDFLDHGEISRERKNLSGVF